LIESSRDKLIVMAMVRLVGRLAPSPTGAQHVGNARTYLVAWLSVRARGGKLVLRIEDIDSPRVKPGAVDAACADLRWLGLDWDEGPVVQSQRLPEYEAALNRLKEQELVYPCTCSRSDVEQSGSAPHGESAGAPGREIAYPGTCAGRKATDAATLEGRPFAWRFRVPAEELSYDDGYLGPQRLRPGGDFVVWKSAGSPAYQLAVVVDDAAQGVCQVVRGSDLVPSTPRQILLYRSLGLKAPSFTHIPLVVGPDGRRLAKRHGDTRLSSLRAAGVKAEALLGLLAWSCRWLDRVEPICARDLLPRFQLDSIPREPLVLSTDLLKLIGYQG
jgi:glutamyl-tRNA synthetase